MRAFDKLLFIKDFYKIPSDDKFIKIVHIGRTDYSNLKNNNEDISFKRFVNYIDNLKEELEDFPNFDSQKLYEMNENNFIKVFSNNNELATLLNDILERYHEKNINFDGYDNILSSIDLISDSIDKNTFEYFFALELKKIYNVNKKDFDSLFHYTLQNTTKFSFQNINVSRHDDNYKFAKIKAKKKFQDIKKCSIKGLINDKINKDTIEKNEVEKLLQLLPFSITLEKSEKLKILQKIDSRKIPSQTIQILNQLLEKEILEQYSKIFDPVEYIENARLYTIQVKDWHILYEDFLNQDLQQKEFFLENKADWIELNRRRSRL